MSKPDIFTTTFVDKNRMIQLPKEAEEWGFTVGSTVIIESDYVNKGIRMKVEKID